MKAKSAVLMIVGAVVALAAANASALDFTGYFRSGVGFDSKGGGQACFGLPGADFKSRLGNECDNYLEVGFGQTLWKDTSGVEFYYQFMPAFGLSTNSTPGTAWGYGSGNLYVQQNWGSVKLPQLGGATIWAGWRYYQRHNIDNLDWFWWNPMQRQGAAGIENIGLGFGTLAFALGRLELSPESGATSAFIVPDIRLGNVGLWTNGTLELGVDLAFYGGGLGGTFAGTAYNSPSVSPWFTVIWTQGKVAGGDNTLAFQYGSGALYRMQSEGGVNAAGSPPSGGVAAGLPTGTSDSYQWRILDQFVYHPVPEFSGELALVYQDIVPAKDNEYTVLTAQVRPAYHFSEYFKIAADFAYQSMDVKKSTVVTTGTPWLFKASLVPTIVAGQKDGLWARPEIRGFVTYGGWGDLLPGTSVANGVFGTDKNGLSWGFQMEAWW